jgi:hypothetical protein
MAPLGPVARQQVPTVVVTLEGRTAVLLRAAAAARDMSAVSLARDLIDTITADNLVTAVLDDGAPAEPPP